MFLGSQHFGAKGACWSSGIGLGRMTKKLFIHSDLHKPNNTLISAQFEHFWCQDKPRATSISQDSPRPGLGETTTSSLQYFLRFSTGATSKWHSVLGLSSGSSRIATIEILATLGAHNFVCRPPTMMRSKAKLQPSSKAFQQYVTCSLHARELGHSRPFSRS